MDRVTVDIPYLELTTGILPEEGMCKSFITPFGIVDITVKECNDNGSIRQEAIVSGDIDTWILALKLKDEFREVLLSFIDRIVRKHFPRTQYCLAATECSIFTNHEPGTGKLKIVFGS